MRFLIKSIFILYFVALYFGPILYFGNIPLATYHIILFILISLITINIIYKRKKIYIPKYMTIFLFVMIFFNFLYFLKIEDSSYIHSVRDFIIIYSSMQYILLVILLSEVFPIENLTLKLIKINLFILPLMGIIAIIQILQLFNIQDILVTFYSKINSAERVEYLSWYARATATFNLEPNTFGLYTAFSLLMYHMFHKILKLNKIYSFYIYIFGIIGLLLSGSFTALLIYIVTTFIYFVAYKKIGLKLVMGLSIIVILLTTFFYENIEESLKRQHITSDNLIPSSLLYRINTKWEHVLNDFNRHPIVGIGPSAIQLDYATDNDFLDKFLRYGVLGGTVYLIFLIYLIVYPLYKRRKVKDELNRLLLFYSSLLALSFVLASLTGTAFKAKRVAELFWIFYSIPFINLYLSRKKEK